MKQTTKIILSLVFILSLGLATWASYSLGYISGLKQNINSFEECAAAGYPITDSYPEQCSVDGGPSFTKDIGQQLTPQTFEGTVVCLPHRDTTGPQTLECAVGLLATDGTYYQLRSDAALGMHAGSDKHFRVTGSLDKTPSGQYQSAGTITVLGFQEI